MLVFIYFQFFVCRKKYVIQFHLKNRLSTFHGIQYPEVICTICCMEFNMTMEQKAHLCKHNKYIPASTAAPNLHHYTFATNIMTSTGWHQTISMLVLREDIPEQHITERPSHSAQEYEMLGLWHIIDRWTELLMYVRDHEVHSNHQLLGAVKDLDQEESSLKTCCVHSSNCAQKVMQQQS